MRLLHAERCHKRTTHTGRCTPRRWLGLALHLDREASGRAVPGDMSMGLGALRSRHAQKHGLVTHPSSTAPRLVLRRMSNGSVMQQKYHLFMRNRTLRRLNGPGEDSPALDPALANRSANVAENTVAVMPTTGGLALPTGRRAWRWPLWMRGTPMPGVCLRRVPMPSRRGPSCPSGASRSGMTLRAPTPRSRSTTRPGTFTTSLWLAHQSSSR